MTPLHIGGMRGFQRVASFLINVGYDPDSKDFVCDLCYYSSIS